MSIDLTQAQRKTATKRQLEIPLESASLGNVKTLTDEKVVKDQAEEDVRKTFWQVQLDIATAYQTEREHLNGPKFTNILDSQIESAAKEEKTSVLLPKDGTYLELFPKVIQEFNGLANGSEAELEEDPINLLQPIVALLKAGYDDGATDSTTTTEAYDASGTEVTSLVGFDPAQRALVYDALGLVWTPIQSVAGSVAAHCIDEDNPPQLTQPACELDNGTWIPTTNDSIVFDTPETVKSGTPGSGATLQNFHPGFTNGERQTTSVGNLQPYFDYLTSQITTHVNAWRAKLVLQKTQLEANNESRTTEAAEVSAALTDVDNAIGIIDTWLAKPNTGVGNKWEDAGIDPIDTEATARLVFIPGRIAEIGPALGTVDVVDPLGSSTGIYGELYKQTDRRCGLLVGSWTKVFRTERSGEVVQSLKDTIDSDLADYDNCYRTEAFSFDGAGSVFIFVESSSGYSVSDSVFILSETEPELTRTIQGITIGIVIETELFDQIELDSSISNLYKKDDCARMVKEL